MRIGLTAEDTKPKQAETCSIHHRPDDGYVRSVRARVYVSSDVRGLVAHSERNAISVSGRRLGQRERVQPLTDNPPPSRRPLRYKFQSSAGTYEDQVATLSDADEIWVKLRHLHMQDAIELLKADFAAFMQENAGFTG